MFSSIVHSLAPEDERAPLLTEHIAIAAEASMRAITASVAVASNLQLVHRDVILDFLLLQQPTVSRARTAPFMGTHLMVLEPNDIYQEIMHLRDQQVMHGRLLDNFRNPAAIGTSQSRSVWIHGGTFCPQACSLNRCQQQQQQFPHQCRQQQGCGRGSGSRPRGQGPFHANDSSTRGPAPTSHKWSAVGGGSPGSICPTEAEPARQLPCIMHPWRQSCWSRSHNLHGLTYPSPSAPGIHPRTCKQQWTSSCPKGQSSQCSIQKPRVSPACLFLVPKNTGDLCPVIDLSHLNDHLVICSSRWKPRHQSGRPSERGNALCPLTYRMHICASPWQGLYRNTSSS